MIDYAKVNTSVDSYSKEQAQSISYTGILALPLLIIILGFLLLSQSITIDNLKHNINVKKIDIQKADFQIDTLYKNYSKLFSSYNIMKEAKKYNMHEAQAVDLIVVHVGH